MGPLFSALINTDRNNCASLCMRCQLLTKTEWLNDLLKAINMMWFFQGTDYSVLRKSKVLDLEPLSWNFCYLLSVALYKQLKIIVPQFPPASNRNNYVTFPWGNLSIRVTYMCLYEIYKQWVCLHIDSTIYKHLFYMYTNIYEIYKIHNSYHTISQMHSFWSA